MHLKGLKENLPDLFILIRIDFFMKNEIIINISIKN